MAWVKLIQKKYIYKIRFDKKESDINIVNFHSKIIFCIQHYIFAFNIIIFSHYISIQHRWNLHAGTIFNISIWSCKLHGTFPIIYFVHWKAKIFYSIVCSIYWQLLTSFVGIIAYISLRFKFKNVQCSFTIISLWIHFWQTFDFRLVSHHLLTVSYFRRRLLHTYWFFLHAYGWMDVLHIFDDRCCIL